MTRAGPTCLLYDKLSTWLTQRASYPSRTRLDRGVGLTGYGVSYVNVTDPRSVAKRRLSRQRDHLDPGELERVEDAVRAYLDH